MLSVKSMGETSMAKGWHISLVDGNRLRLFKAGIVDADEAKRQVLAQCSRPSGVGHSSIEGWRV